MKTKLQLLFWGICFLIPATYQAQGEQLFKAKCNVCHLVDKNSTGPNLKGVKDKWASAGEADLLYEWVKNPQGLLTSGKSKMAKEIENFSPSAMTPQDLTNEEIDAVLSYVDAYTPPPPPPTEVTGTDIKLVPNYSDNLTLFYWLLACTFILLLGILLLSNSIISLIKSDYFKKKLSEKKDTGGMKTLVILVVMTLFGFSNQSMAMSVNDSGAESAQTLWLLVEQTDLYLLLCINLILLGVLLYLGKLFKSFMQLVADEKATPVVQESAFKKINQVLTDVVPIEEEEKILLEHEYDGIRELDNNLPPWWVWGFFATIVFAVIYLFNYHVFKTGDLQIVAYNKDIKKSELEVSAYLEKMAMNVDENNATAMTEASDLSAGKSVFNANCITCHNPNGEGNIGPNLTDKTWIYGYDIKEVFKTIKNGTPNGMPDHASKLNPIQIQQVSSYLLVLPEKVGKAAEGTIIEK